MNATYTHTDGTEHNARPIHAVPHTDLPTHTQLLAQRRGGNTSLINNGFIIKESEMAAEAAAPSTLLYACRWLCDASQRHWQLEARLGEGRCNPLLWSSYSRREELLHDKAQLSPPVLFKQWRPEALCSQYRHPDQLKRQGNHSLRRASVTQHEGVSQCDSDGRAAKFVTSCT